MYTQNWQKNFVYLNNKEEEWFDFLQKKKIEKKYKLSCVWNADWLIS